MFFHSSCVNECDTTTAMLHIRNGAGIRFGANALPSNPVALRVMLSQRLSEFAAWPLPTSQHALVSAWPRCGFPLVTLPQRPDLRGADDFVDVCTGSRISVCELCDSFSDTLQTTACLVQEPRLAGRISAVSVSCQFHTGYLFVCVLMLSWNPEWSGSFALSRVLSSLRLHLEASQVVPWSS